MNTMKSIQTQADLDAALARIEEIFDAEEGTAEGDELGVLFDLVELYESKTVEIGFPTAIEAIEFRMDQAGLSPRDLIPFIGSRARVSEVLSGKRSITMSMARALNRHLGIPADVLLRESGADSGSTLDDIAPQRFPLNAMAKLGWISGGSDLKDRAGELIAGLIGRAGGPEVAAAVLYRKNDHRRINAKADEYALRAWCWQVMATANDRQLDVTYEPGIVTPGFLRQAARLSPSEEGPKRVKDFLAEHGIALEIVPHLPRTHLDGAALRLGDGRPVIGLTLRYDRIDNFWFCLLHELAHVGLHLHDNEPGAFVDDHSLRSRAGGGEDPKEVEADEWAEEALIPRAAWETSQARTRPNVMAVIDLAQTLGVHPAIVAGRIRYERGNYRLLSQFVGARQVRRQFHDAV